MLFHAEQAAIAESTWEGSWIMNYKASLTTISPDNQKKTTKTPLCVDVLQRPTIHRSLDAYKTITKSLSQIITNEIPT